MGNGGEQHADLAYKVASGRRPAAGAKIPTSTVGKKEMRDLIEKKRNILEIFVKENLART
jgi:hypothetical protein